LSDSLKNTMLLGHFMVTRYRGHYYAEAQNLVRRLRRAYDERLARYDLLLIPTLPIVATPLPEANAPVKIPSPTLTYLPSSCGLGPITREWAERSETGQSSSGSKRQVCCTSASFRRVP
jgi:Asp-tRNA(Asn)/Glu-tRNA(Gln) amidotransferase A subunit family amidase